MTDRAAPGAQGSTVRNIEFGEMGGAPAPFIVPFGELSRSAQRWDDLENPAQATSVPERGPFGRRAQLTSSDTVNFNPGEGFVNGWFATDEEKTVDISDYQNERVTFVVGWDPDALYSSDVHDTREKADRVFVDIEDRVDSTKPFIPILSAVPIDDGEGGMNLDEDTLIDYRPIGRPMETLGPALETDGDTETTIGPGVTLLRGRPTTFTGGVQTGPFEATPDENNVVVVNQPVTPDAEAGQEVSYQFQLGTESVFDVKGTANGEGGVNNPHVTGGQIVSTETPDVEPEGTEWLRLDVGAQVWSYEGLSSEIRAVEYYRDDVIVCDDDGIIASFDPDDGSLNWTHENDARYWDVATFEGTVYTADRDSDAIIAINTDDGSVRWENTLPTTAFGTVIVDSNTVVYSSDDELVGVDPDDGSEQWTNNEAALGYLTSWNGLAISTDNNSNLTAVDAGDGSLVESTSINQSQNAYRIEARNGILYSTNQDETVLRTSLETFKPHWKHEHHTNRTFDVVERDGLLFSGSWDGTVVVADASDGTLINQVNLDTGRVYSVEEQDGVVYTGHRRGEVLATTITPYSYISDGSKWVPKSRLGINRTGGSNE